MKFWRKCSNKYFASQHGLKWKHCLEVKRTCIRFQETRWHAGWPQAYHLIFPTLKKSPYMTFLGTSLRELKNKYTVNPPIIITAVTMGAETVVSKQAGHNLIFFKYLLQDNIAICLTLTIFSFCLKKHRERKYQLLPLTSTYPFQPHMH